MIEAFLCALMEESVHRQIMQGEGILRRLRQQLQQVFRRTPSYQETSHLQPLEDLVAYMQEIEPNFWPDVMKAEGLSIS